MNAITVHRTDFPALFSREPLARLLDAEGLIRHGKGWKEKPITILERQTLQAAQANLESRHAIKNEEFIIAQLALLSNQFKSVRSQAEWEALYDDYANQLQEFPIAVFHDVLTAHKRSKSWFPKIADLVLGCEAQLAKERRDLHRIRVLLRVEAPRWFERAATASDEPAHQRSQEERQALIEKTRRERGYQRSKPDQPGAASAGVFFHPEVPYREATAALKAERMEVLRRRLEKLGDQQGLRTSTISTATKVQKQRDRPFPKGSGQLSARPQWSKNRARIVAGNLLDGEAEALNRKAVEMAQGGDSVVAVKATVTTSQLTADELPVPPNRE